MQTWTLICSYITNLMVDPLIMLVECFTAGKKVSLHKLRSLKYTDEEGREHNIDIIERASHKWTKISDLICYDASQASTLQQQYPDPCNRLRQILVECFIDNKPSNDYSQNWSGLINLFNDAGLGKLAKEVEYALTHSSME